MKKAASVLLCLLLILGLASCGTKVAAWNGKTEVFADLLMVADVSDPHISVAMVDHVFVGTVTGIQKNILPKKTRRHDDNYSVYEIRVDQNLKGALEGTVVCSKLGGFRKDGTMLIVCAETPSGAVIVDSGMPEQDRQYIFMAYAQPDGSLILSEIFDNRVCNEDLIREYREYIDDQAEIDRHNLDGTPPTN